ncbi:MAG: hypothetical protein FD143_1355 [Ignavibacteria bacterium]|nr:MAG: hypothetical protein FD143_1355 [Ignavibacteria bacterium]KAF0160661.1 MAG: hypothetical protein FD188_1568 [Ignavibacteria bacterium]
MRRNLLIIFFFAYLIPTVILRAEIEIKSLRVYIGSNETSFPVIDFASSDEKTITIDFDVQTTSYPNLIIQFKFCDSNWQPYENQFLQNPLYNTEYNLWLDKIPNGIKGARFHYTGSFPNNNVQFPFSGKWMFFITDSHNKNLVYAAQKFFVVLPGIKLNVQVTRETMQGSFGDKANLGRTLAIKTSFTLPDSLFPSNVRKIEIVKNRMITSPIVIDRNVNNQERYYEWDAARKFSFVARQLRPGNEYRQIDTRSITNYPTETVDARFGEHDQSDLFTKRKRDFNGSSLLLNYRNPNADYQNVVFKLKAPENVTKPIFLVGSFNDWKLLPEFEMYDDKGMMNFSISLKRGVHAYQYVAANINGNRIANADWEILEGNFFETENEYFIFLYYESPEKGGYNKIIGYEKIRTGAL